MTAPPDGFPKYVWAYRTLLEWVKTGRFPVGARMPTEAELSEQFGVSRVTVRRALDMLVQEGYIESRQGSGYRVLTLSPASDTCLTSFTDQMLRAGREPTTQLVSIDTFDPGHDSVSHLPEQLRTGPITRVVRLRKVDGTPRMLVMTYAPSHMLEGALPQDFPDSGPAQSILRILARRFGLEWSAACEDITPILSDATTADLFSIEKGLPLLLQACSAFGEDGTIVFHEDAYRMGAVSFTLTRQSRTARDRQVPR